jgi:hypothetical protein
MTRISASIGAVTRRTGWTALAPLTWTPVASNLAIIIVAASTRIAYLGFARPAFDGSIATDFNYELELPYPAFLAAVRATFGDHALGAQLAQVIVSVCGALLLRRLTVALTTRRSVGTIAALLYACDPLLIKQSVERGPMVLVTVLLIALAFGVVTATTPRGAVWTGLCTAALVLTRAMTLPLIIAVCACLWLRERRRLTLVAAISAVGVIAPAAVLVHHFSGAWLPTRSGLNLWLGSLPEAAILMPKYDPDVLTPLAETAFAVDRSAVPDDLSDVDRDRWLTHVAARNAADLGRTVRTRLSYVAYFFWPPVVPQFEIGPQTRVGRASNGQLVVVDAVARSDRAVRAYSVYYAAILLAAALGIFTRRACLRRDAILWCMLGLFVVVHAIYFPATRYRGPVTFVLLFFSAVAIHRIGSVILDRAVNGSLHPTLAVTPE